MMKLHSLYGSVLAEMTREMRQRVLSEEQLNILKERVTELKRLLVETFDAFCDSCLCNLNYRLPDLMV